MGRFGGWQAQWLAQTIMMTSDEPGRNISNGLQYHREVGMKPEVAQVIGTTTATATAMIFDIGIVDIQEAWLCSLIPDIKRRDAFLRGDKDVFFAE